MATTTGAPSLGLATTEQLIEELRARVELDYFRGGGGLHYTTVGGRPVEASPVNMSAIEGDN